MTPVERAALAFAEEATSFVQRVLTGQAPADSHEALQPAADAYQRWQNLARQEQS